MSYSSSSSTSPPPKKLSARDKWLAKVPADQEKFIQAVADKMREHGSGFEDVLREREKENPKFQFLFNKEVRQSSQAQLIASAAGIPLVQVVLQLTVSRANTSP